MGKKTINKFCLVILMSGSTFGKPIVDIKPTILVLWTRVSSRILTINKCIITKT